MQARIEARYAKLVDLAQALDTVCWTTKDAAVKAMAAEAKDGVVRRVEQAAWILRARYGVWM
jgi:hypothetical protein